MQKNRTLTLRTKDSRVVRFHLFEADDCASKIPIVYVCGAFQTIESVQRTLIYLLKLNPVLVIELPSFGLTPHIKNVTTEELVEDLITTVHTVIGQQPFNLLGISYGGLFSILALERLPHCRALVLCGVSYFSDIVLNTLRHAVTAIHSKDYQLAADLFVGLTATGKTRACLAMKERLKITMASLTEDDFQKFADNTQRLLDLQNITLPIINRRTLFLTGEEDELTPPEKMQELADAYFTQATVLTVPKFDHFYPMTQKVESAQIIHDFFDEPALFAVQTGHLNSQSA